VTSKIGRGLSALPDRETARPWPDIETMFAELARIKPVFEPLAALARHLSRSAFTKAGLCGGTSMHDIVVGPSTYVIQNPHLRLEYDFDAKAFQMIYVDGSTKPWERSVPPEQVNDAVDRFLTKRVRWYHVL
jgi:hypothetical protein